MGTKPYMVASSLRAVVSQRLVRSVCSRCREFTKPDPELLAMLPAERRNIEKVTQGKGCPQCFNTGYRGRVVIAELLVVDDLIRSQIIDGTDRLGLQRSALDAGMVPIFFDGLEKVSAGVTSLEEVIGATDLGGDDSYEGVEAREQAAMMTQEAVAPKAAETPAAPIAEETGPREKTKSSSKGAPEATLDASSAQLMGVTARVMDSEAILAELSKAKEQDGAAGDDPTSEEAPPN
jgi:hypothetical protein